MKQSSTSSSVTPPGFTRSAWMSARSHFGPDGDETRLPLFDVSATADSVVSICRSWNQPVVALGRQDFDMCLRNSVKWRHYCDG